MTVNGRFGNWESRGQINRVEEGAKHSKQSASNSGSYIPPHKRPRKMSFSSEESGPHYRHYYEGSNYSEEKRDPLGGFQDFESKYKPRFRGGKNVFNQEDMEESVERSQNCLLGLWIDDRDFGIGKINEYIQEYWSIPAEVIHKCDNLYVVKFRNKEEAMVVLHRSPFAIDGGLMAFSRWGSDMQLAKLKITKVKVPIQIHGLPGEYFTPRAAIKAANMAGEVADVDIDVTPARNIKFLRAKLWIKPENPLLSGFDATLVSGKTVNLDVKYERIHRLCKRCGVIGHYIQRCPIIDDEELEEFVEKFVGAHYSSRGSGIIQNTERLMFPNSMIADAHREIKRNTDISQSYVMKRLHRYRNLKEKEIQEGFLCDEENFDPYFGRRVNREEPESQQANTNRQQGSGGFPVNQADRIIGSASPLQNEALHAREDGAIKELIYISSEEASFSVEGALNLEALITNQQVMLRRASRKRGRSNTDGNGNNTKYNNNKRMTAVQYKRLFLPRNAQEEAGPNRPKGFKRAKLNTGKRQNSDNVASQSAQNKDVEEEEGSKSHDLRDQGKRGISTRKRPRLMEELGNQDTDEHTQQSKRSRQHSDDSVNHEVGRTTLEPLLQGQEINEANESINHISAGFWEAEPNQPPEQP